MLRKKPRESELSKLISASGNCTAGRRGPARQGLGKFGLCETSDGKTSSREADAGRIPAFAQFRREVTAPAYSCAASDFCSSLRRR
jgi:hypothetical protein